MRHALPFYIVTIPHPIRSLYINMVKKARLFVINVSHRSNLLLPCYNIAMKLSPINKSIYTTLITEDAAVGDRFVLRKASHDLCDDEAIGATLILSGIESQADEKAKKGKKADDQALTLADDFCYVANSVKTVARGTYSAGRLYDQFEKYLVVAVEFTLCGFAICKVLGEIDPKTDLPELPDMEYSNVWTTPVVDDWFDESAHVDNTPANTLDE